MRRLAAFALVALVCVSCSTRDRNEVHLGAPITVANATAVQAMALDGDRLYYGVFDTGEIYEVNARKPATPTLLTTVNVRAKGANGLMSLAVERGRLYVSFVRPDRRLVVERVLGKVLVWQGPIVNSLQRVGHIAFDNKGVLHVSLADRIVRVVDGKAETLTKDWVNPFAFAIDARNRIFVADQPPLRGKSFVARGRETDPAKRKRFATGLPAGSKPSGLVFLGDELLVCRATAGDAFRLHIGLDNTPRRRNPVDAVKCRNAIAVGGDGSLITAIAHEIRRYPPA